MSANDITSRSFKMARNAAILYRRSIPGWQGDDPPEFSGLILTRDGARFWINCWRRTVNGKEVLEIRQVPAKPCKDNRG